MYEHELSNYIDALKGNLTDKDVLITQTANKDSLAFNLAHIFRLYAKRTFCCDANYKMSDEPEGYRIIEEGKVILIQGDLQFQREKVYSKIEKVKGNKEIDIEIIIQ